MTRAPSFGDVAVTVRRIVDARVWPMARPAAFAALAVALATAGCVATTNTIGGHDEAEIARWAEEAKRECLQRTGLEPPHRFTTDGCTLAPDCVWQSCCVDHDKTYWCGGSAKDRRRADRKLRTCVADTSGSTTIATLVYWGVRLGGDPWLPGYWRWGYGWPWLRGYVDDRHP